MSHLYQEKPIPFISYDSQNSSYNLESEACEMIKSIKSPLAIIAVAGFYRTGKSYLLNHMILDTQNGFGVGNTINACTKGLWIWGTPIKGKTNDGREISILVVDSEGIGSLEEDAQHDTKVFTLAVLVSSCFIYNSVGNIDENAINNLSLVVNLTKNIQIKNNQDDIDSDQYGQYFPSFYWIVRDFTLDLVDEEGDPITSKEYLEKCLAEQSGFSDGIEQKNRIKKLLKTFFQDRDCFTVVRPVLDEGEIQNLNKRDLKTLRPEFQKQVLELRGKVRYQVKPKLLNGQELSGDQYVTIVKSYVDAINSGACPNIENSWTQLCRLENIKALDMATSYYEEQVNQNIIPKLPLAQHDLKQQLKEAHLEAIEIYKKKAIGEVIEEYRKDLINQIKSIKSDCLIQNDIESRRTCQDFIQQQYKQIKQKLNNGEYESFSEFDKDIELFNNYLCEHGPQLNNSQLYYQEFINQSLKDGAKYFLRKLEENQQILKNLAQENQLKFQNQQNECQSQLNELQDQLNKLRQIENEKNEIQQRLQQLNEDNQSIQQEKEQLKKTLQNEVEVEKNKMSELINKQQEQLNEQQEQNIENDKKNQQIIQELQQEKQKIQQQQQLLEQQIEQQKNEIKVIKG